MRTVSADPVRPTWFGFLTLFLSVAPEGGLIIAQGKGALATAALGHHAPLDFFSFSWLPAPMARQSRKAKAGLLTASIIYPLREIPLYSPILADALLP